MTIEAGTSVQFLPGVGPRRAKLLAKLEIETVQDLLWHLPRAWVDRSRITPLAELVPGARQTSVVVVRRGSVARARGDLALFRAELEDSSGRAGAIWFHQPYLAQRLTPGLLLLLSGTVRWQEGRAQFVHPEYEVLARGGDPALSGGRIVPIYPLAAGVTQKLLRSCVWTALEQLGPHTTDPLPVSVRDRLRLPALRVALREVHFPQSMEEAERARERLAFDELFTLQLALSLARRRRESAQFAPALRPPGRLGNELRARLPFRLTAGQERALREILDDLGRTRPMNRLLQGDVGSGKTVVAALACLAAAESGGQAAYLAPTEILAAQQARLLESWFAPLGVPTALLLGRTRAAERRRTLGALRDGELRVIVGTHALLEEEIVFRRLDLVVVDEQHRFGVLQRHALRSKGEADDGGRRRVPHCLVMSATPIPRTLYLTLCADLDLSLLREMPAGRVPPRTRIVEESQRERMLSWIGQRLRAGDRAFIVYPLVEESEQLDLRDAVSAAEALAGHPAFRGVAVGLLHGRMKGPEKESAIAAFREGKTPALVTTTVVEVGVDVPQATIMVVEHAERFGLSQLHQLRGRVGRGGGASHVFLMTRRRSDQASERLKVLVAHADGFAVAEEDYRLRGPGEILGTAQHGLPRFRVADLCRNRELPRIAREEAERILLEDGELRHPDHRPLRAQIGFLYGRRLPLVPVG